MKATKVEGAKELTFDLRVNASELLALHHGLERALQRPSFEIILGLDLFRETYVDLMKVFDDNRDAFIHEQHRMKAEEDDLEAAEAAAARDLEARYVAKYGDNAYNVSVREYNRRMRELDAERN